MNHEPMTQEQLDEIQERVNDATSGPWDCYGNGAHEVFDAGEYDDGDPGELVAPVVTKLDDAEFIAHARTDVPALLAEVERLRADNTRLRARLTVDDAMAERSARVYYGYQNPGELAAHPMSWERLTTTCPNIADIYRYRVGTIINAALNPGEGS